MTFWRSIRRSLDVRRDRVFDLLRIYLGVGLFTKGVLFASDPNLVPSLLHDGGHFAATPVMIAHYVVGAHLIGGVLLVLGLFTRAAALAQLPILFGAVFVVHAREGMFSRGQNLEFALLVLFLLVLVVVHGGGRWSLDHYVGEIRNQTDFGLDVDAHPRSA